MRPGGFVLLLLAILMAGCVVPGGDGPAPTKTPTPGAPHTQPQLKYLLLDHYGEDRFFFCDPDYYPVARGDELERAVSMFPEIEKDPDVFPAIIARKGLQPPYSNATKLLIYREYKKLRAIPLDLLSGDVYSFSLQLGDRVAGRRVSGTVRSDGTILSEQSEEAALTCPICLSGETLIDTPGGPVQVKDIRVGMLVWTFGPEGIRRAVPVLRTVQTPIAPFHRFLHLRLSDGRELVASPGHPTMDGRPVGTFSIGERLDGGTVIGADPIPATGKFTYDVLPAGDTGGYRANGIPVKSTLFSEPGLFGGSAKLFGIPSWKLSKAWVH